MKKLSDIISQILNAAITKKIAAKYPRLFRFVSERLSLNKFVGLPLTLLLAAFAANLMLFNEIAENIENSKWMLSIDNSLAKYLFSVRTDTVANMFFYFSKFGSLSVVTITASVSVVVLLFMKRLVYVFALLVSLTGTGITILIGKVYFHRIRPDGLSFYNETLYSFPSGHSIIAVAFYGLLFYFIIRHNVQHKISWTILSILFILMLGFSRLYLCVHYLSDVFAGYSLGFLWLLLSVSIIEWKFQEQVE